jgi:hypothetical protein
VTYSVKEIFLTLQGEGGQAGKAAVFCRFAGCNLWTGREQDRAKAVCTFCDTDFVGTDGENGGKFATADDLAAAVEAQWTGGPDDRLVVCTGGEPFLQLDEAAIDALHARGFQIACESNGTLQAPAGPRLDLHQPQGRRACGPDLGPGAEAGLPAGQGHAGAVRGPGFRALLPAADGRAGPRQEHAIGRRLLPFAPTMAFKRPNAQISRPALRIRRSTW